MTKSKKPEDLNQEIARLSRQIAELQSSEIRHKQIELDLQRSEARFRELAELLPESIFETTLDGTLTFANNSGLETFGYTQDDLDKGLNAFDMIAPESRELAKSNIAKVFKGENLGNNEYIAITKDKKRFPVILHSTPIAHDGKLIGLRGIIVNISRIKEAEEIIKKANEVLEKKVSERTLELKIANEKLNDILEGTVKALSSAVEKRDPYTAGHQQGVANLATAIARKLGLDENQVKGINISGLIHDIGKIYIPAEILSKPSTLSDIEMEMIRMHSKMGYDVLSAIDFPWPIADTVLQHHERLDGSGYPNKLKVNSIILEAKIIAVSDVVEAMASHRPYRPSLGIEAALKEISDNKGTLYDEKVVEACLYLFETGQVKLTPSF